MILTNDFLIRESIKRDIGYESETRILNENHSIFSKKIHTTCLYHIAF